MNIKRIVFYGFMAAIQTYEMQYYRQSANKNKYITNRRRRKVFIETCKQANTFFLPLTAETQLLHDVHCTRTHAHLCTRVQYVMFKQ